MMEFSGYNGFYFNDRETNMAKGYARERENDRQRNLTSLPYGESQREIWAIVHEYAVSHAFPWNTQQDADA